MESSFNFFSATASGLSVSWKLCLNLCSRRWLSPSCSLVSSFAPIGLWQPKILFAVGLMNLRIFDLKTLGVSELRMLESNLFHSIMVDGKYEFLKNWCFTLIWGILSAFLVLYGQFDCGFISKKYIGHWFLYTLKKRHSFLYQRLCWRDSKPSSWLIFSLDDPLMAPVIAEAALREGIQFFGGKNCWKLDHKLYRHNRDES